MRRGFALLGLAVAVAVAAVAAMFAGHGPSSASASSHSEAPLISQDPRADNTDLYAFVSPEATNTVTIIANYIPLESPASGPNFPSFDDSVLYEIKIDNNGDGQRRPQLPVPLRDADEEPGHVPLQHWSDQLAERHDLEPAAELHGLARQVQAEWQCEPADRDRNGHDASR